MAVADLGDKSGLSWAWSMGNPEYAIEHAPTGRASCKICKATIAKGDVRISIYVEETDHSGSQAGSFHPACLIRSFGFKSSQNPKILNITQIKGFDDLTDEEKATIVSLFRNPSKAPAAAAPAAVAPASVKGLVQISKVSADDDAAGVKVSGSTFPLKERLRELGGAWHAASQTWLFANPQKLLDAAGRTMADLQHPVLVEARTIAVRCMTTSADESERANDRGGHRPEAQTVAQVVPIEIHGNLATCSKKNLTRLCKARQLPVSGTIEQLIQRLQADATLKPDGPDVDYRKEVFSIVSCGHIAMPTGIGASNLPWGPDGLPRAA